jgi:hypothetical protein
VQAGGGGIAARPAANASPPRDLMHVEARRAWAIILDAFAEEDRS